MPISANTSALNSLQEKNRHTPKQRRVIFIAIIILALLVVPVLVNTYSDYRLKQVRNSMATQYIALLPGANKQVEKEDECIGAREGYLTVSKRQPSEFLCISSFYMYGATTDEPTAALKNMRVLLDTLAQDGWSDEPGSYADLLLHKSKKPNPEALQQPTFGLVKSAFLGIRCTGSGNYTPPDTYPKITPGGYNLSVNCTNSHYTSVVTIYQKLFQVER